VGVEESSLNFCVRWRGESVLCSGVVAFTFHSARFWRWRPERAVPACSRRVEVSCRPLRPGRGRKVTDETKQREGREAGVAKEIFPGHQSTLQPQKTLLTPPVDNQQPLDSIMAAAVMLFSIVGFRASSYYMWVVDFHPGEP